MKSLLIVFLGTCLSFSSFSNFSAEKPSANIAPMGSIVMEDAIMMLVDTEAPGITVTSIKVYDSNRVLVFSDTSCNNSECQVNLSSLDPGDYDVDVETNVLGGGFSGSVTLL